MTAGIWAGAGSVIIIAVLSWYALWRFDMPRIGALVAGLAALGLAILLVYWAGRSKYQ